MSFLTKPDPFSSEVNRLFNSLLAPTEGRAQRWTPAMDLAEAEDHYTLRADLPGMDEKDVAIEINDNVLTVAGERHDEQERGGQGWHRVERTFGRFSRSLTLPEGVDPEAVSASFDKGVLTIDVPKPEQRKPRRVQINVGGGSDGEGESIGSGPVEGTATDRTAGDGTGSSQPEAAGAASSRAETESADAAR